MENKIDVIKNMKLKIGNNPQLRHNIIRPSFVAKIVAMQ